jgi:membrane protease YdiL (CAAX protease family)
MVTQSPPGWGPGDGSGEPAGQVAQEGEPARDGQGARQVEQWGSDPWATMPWPAPSQSAGQNGGSSASSGSNGSTGAGGAGSGLRATSQERSPLPASAAWWAAVGGLVGLVLGGIGAAIGQSITGSSTSALSDLLGEAGLWTAMLATVILVSRRYGTGSLRRDFGLAIKRMDLVWGVCAWVAALLVSALVLEVFSGTKFAGTNDQILTQQKGHEAGVVVVSLIVALGAPFFEELFFRGFLRTALQARFGGHGAVWLQAVFFGLAHTGEAGTTLGNVSVVLAMFLVGVVLGYTAKLTGRLGAGMIAHGLFNLVAVISVL